MRGRLAQGVDDAGGCKLRGQQVRPDATMSDYYGLLSELVNVGGPSSGDHRSAPGAAGSGVDEFLDASARAAPPEAVAATAQAPLPAGQTAPSSNPSPANGSASTVKDGRELLVNRDPLTELPHRQALAEMLKSALQRKRPGSSLSLLWIDLHQFKSINDRFGYRVGDRALREVAKRLRASIRSTDIIARLGGDEFAVVQEHAQGNDAVEALARHIACQLDRPFSVGGHKFAVGAYIGIAALGDERLDAEGLMRRADQALQEAKRDGRRGYRWFDGEFADRTRLRNQIRADLAIAIVREELTLNYQPIVDLAKHCVIGFEALLRWDHPVHGRINPSDFIPIAEESGLILPISDWVLKAACRDAVGWPGHVKVSVNLSPIQFKLGDPVHSIERALAASGLPPQRLECEITESTIIQDVDRTLAAVRKMKAWGATVSLDDFGTGYSSLNCLSLLPFDRIKIDRSFVTGADAGNGAFAILETIATLGRALGATTVLEGVETLDQLALAVSKGCSAVQGYLFSPPWPSDKALDIIADVNARASSYLANITVDPVL